MQWLLKLFFTVRISQQNYFIFFMRFWNLSWVFSLSHSIQDNLLGQQSSFLAVYLGKHQLLFQQFHSFPFRSRFYQSNFHQALNGFVLQWKSFVWEKKSQSLSTIEFEVDQLKTISTIRQTFLNHYVCKWIFFSSFSIWLLP